MATLVFLGGLKPKQEPVPDPKRKESDIDTQWHGTLRVYRGYGDLAIIAKGNIIEGIEAKW